MRVNVSIRKENIEAWKSLGNKSGWVNDMLSRLGAPSEATEPYYASKEVVREETRVEDSSIDVREYQTIAQVMAKKHSLENELKEKLAYCQDSGESFRMETLYRGQIQALWDRYHELKKA